jgi:hypothetical protein
MKNFVLTLNGEVCEVFSSKENVINFLKKSWYLESLILENKDYEEEEFSLEEGVEFLLKRFVKVECYNEDLVERGDDFCEIGLSEMEVL